MHIVHGFCPALHSSHSTSPEFASNLATSASSLHSTSAQPAPRPLPSGVHLSNAQPSLSLDEMHHSIFVFRPFFNLQVHSGIQCFSLLFFAQADSMLPHILRPT
ncbi:hypothetical protein ATANTOWER_003097 [Ataeniobius toweri]|uniref:Uncharacterized protein n=1 Tax=Ataeniobius toweri TaxID=208326 RepID=A0ABU7CHP6_9TELE|nr:hypothetical protein [Ataeniobius toweri]